jgi:hypothetical protein
MEPSIFHIVSADHLGLQSQFSWSLDFNLKQSKGKKLTLHPNMNSLSSHSLIIL